MGFRIAPRMIGLRWPEGHALHGLEITVARFDLEAYLMQCAALALADNLASWNLEDATGRMMPLSREAVAGVDPGLRAALIMAWREAMATPPAEAAAAPDIEAGLPMDPLPPQEAPSE